MKKNSKKLQDVPPCFVSSYSLLTLIKPSLIQGFCCGKKCYSESHKQLKAACESNKKNLHSSCIILHLSQLASFFTASVKLYPYLDFSY